MKKHICIESRTCTCGITADEPDESCPVHGAGEWPPRCEICGQFMKRETDESLSFYRAAGECLCDQCGKPYYKHPMGGPFTDTMGYRPYQWLHRLCNGDLVKL